MTDPTDEAHRRRLPLPRHPDPNPGAFRAIPSVSRLVADADLRAATGLTVEALTVAVQSVLDSERAAIAAGATPTSVDVRTAVMTALADLERPRLIPLINATGVIIHTNLGRSPVSADAARAMAEAAGGYVALEIEPRSNERGGRMREIADLMRLLTGAEATVVVNNCAAAVLLVLTAAAAGRRVVVSRGEAVEIGGGFRVPDVLRQSGATLVEVGTTNRTYARDYAEATDDQTAAYLKIHPSNFQITGFTHAATVAELVTIARPRGVPVFEDVGSGALLDTTKYGLAHEPTLRDSLIAGATLVMASGDKLVGGPQAGIIAGNRGWVERVAGHPLARAVRADKTCLAGLAATLRHYARGEAESCIPVWRMISASADELRTRVSRLHDALRGCGVQTEVVPTAATVGGGSLPGQMLSSWGLVLGVENRDDDVDRLAHQLRLGHPGVYGRIESGRLLLDVRTVLPEDDDRLVRVISGAVSAA